MNKLAWLFTDGLTKVSGDPEYKDPALNRDIHAFDAKRSVGSAGQAVGSLGRAVEGQGSGPITKAWNSAASKVYTNVGDAMLGTSRSK